MGGSQLVTHLRERRAAAGLSQSDLADRVGLSRQAVLAIEAGRQLPSTAVALRLARVLRCNVEELFALPGGPSFVAHWASSDRTPSATRLLLGCVDGEWAAPPAEGDRPADALLVAEETGGRARVEPLADVADLERNVLVAGCAPLLGVFTGRLAQHRDARASWISADSGRALDLLARGLVHVAGLHLVDAAEPEGHRRIIQQRFPTQTMIIVNLTLWRQGLVVAAGNPLGIRGVSDLQRSDVQLARRGAGSGAQTLLERLLAVEGIGSEALANGPLASGHTEVARLVRLGLADVGVAAEAAALAEGLSFIPLAEERFDLVVPQTRFEVHFVARLFDRLEKPAFRADAGRIGGYDLSTAGHAVTVVAE